MAVEGFKIADAYAEVHIDEDSLNRDLTMLETRLRAIRDRAIKVGIDTSEIDPELLLIQEKINSMVARLHVEPDIDIDATKATLDRLLRDITRSRTQLNIIPDTAEIRRSMKELEARLRGLRGKVDIGLDAKKIGAELEKIRAEFALIHDKSISIGLETGKIPDQLMKIRAEIELLSEAYVLKPHLNTEELRRGLTEVRGMIAGVQKDFNVEFKMEGIDRAIAEMQGANFQLDRLKKSMAEYIAISSLSGVGAGNRRWWLNWVHWIIAGGAELAAVVVPATIALGSAAAVVAQGAQQAEQHMVALWTATEATNKYMHMTTGQALGMRAALQQAQDAADPKVYQAMGGAIDIAKHHLLDMAGAGVQMVTMFDHFIAHFQYSLATGMGQNIHGLLDQMVPDAVKLGIVFANLGHALVNFAAAMPGLAGVLLNFLVAITSLIEKISELPPWLITTFMLFEEVWRWGGAAATVLARLSGALAELGTLGVPLLARFGTIFSSVLKFIPMTLAGIAVNLGATIQKFSLFGSASAKAGEAVGKLGFSLVSFAEFLSTGWGLAIAGAVVALIGLYFWMSRFKSVTQDFIDASNRAVEAANSMHVLNVITAQMGQTLARTAQATRDHADAVQRQSHYVNDGTRGFLAYSDRVRITQANIDALHQHQDGLTQSMKNVLYGAAELSSQYRTSFFGALVLATNAGVKLQDGILGQGQAARIARFQIADYVAGLRAMGQPLGAVGNDMSALAIQSGLASTKVSQLNQAWDEFLANVTGGTNAFSGFVLAIQGMGITALKTSASMQGTVSSIDLHKRAATSATTATTGFANSLTAAGQKGAQTWQQFNAAITGPGQQMLDWFRTAGAEGQITSDKLTYAVRAIISQMLPLAQHSKVATAELSAMAQEAGGPFTSNFKTLKEWVDQGGHSMSGLRKIVDQTTIRMANMADVASKLGNVMQQQIISSMDAAQLKASGLTDAVNNLTNYINANGVAGLKQSGVYRTVRDILIRLTGSTSEADSMIQAYTGHIDAGKTALQKEHDALKASRDMQNEYNDAVQKGNQPQKNLIQNLANIGRQAGIGTDKIAALIHKITGIPTKVILSIIEHGTGHFSIVGNLPGGGLHYGIGGQKYGGQGPGVTGAAKGMLVPGYGGGDRHLALVEGGEAIVPKEVVPHVAAVLKRHGVPGFQGGGFIQSGIDPGQSTVTYDERFRSQVTQSMERAMTTAMKAAMSAARREMMGGGPRGPATHAAMPYLENLWIAAGGPPGVAHLMAAIAMAESGGNSRAYNPSGASGLWQILGVPFPGNPFDPFTNARMAVAKYESQGLGAWVTYTSGAYRAYYAKGTSGAAPGWGVVGELGPELVRFHGGEPVVPMYARGTPGISEVVHDLMRDRHVFTDIRDLLRNIHKHFTGARQRHLDHLVAQQEKHLRHIAGTVDRTVAAARTYRTSVAQGLSGYADVSGLLVGGAYTAQGYVSGGAFLNMQLQQRLQSLRKFTRSIKALGKAGVSRGLIKQIVAMGPDAGQQIADEILAMGHRQIKELLATEEAVGAAEQGLAGQAAASAYGSTSLNLAAGFRRQRREIEREVDHWARRFGQEAARWFHVPRHATGGTIPMGSSGIVGEAGLPELVSVGPGGAVVTPGVSIRGAGGMTVINQYYGTQYPTPEMQRRMNMDMALAFGVAP